MQIKIMSLLYLYLTLKRKQFSTSINMEAYEKDVFQYGNMGIGYHVSCY